MKIEDALAIGGVGAYYWRDEEAIKRGAQKNGFLYSGAPVTEGFKDITEPSEIVSIILFFLGNRTAIGDCCSVVYGARSGRDPLFRAATYQPFIEQMVLPHLVNREMTSFKKMAEEVDALEINGKPLHCAIRYGITQALLDLAAQSRGVTMTEVICDEYRTQISERPVPIFLQAGYNWYEGVDKDILRRANSFPHAAVNSLEKLDQLTDYITWTKNRIQELAGSDYVPYLHYDVYATLGIRFDNNIPKIVEHLKTWEDAAKPYKLIIEEPVDMKSKKGQIEMMRNLIKAKNEAGLSTIICADEWCNTVEDVKDFVMADAAEMIQIKTPDMGGINNSIEAILYCQRNGVLPYLGGSCSETDVAAKITWHIAMATQPFQTLAKPGLGIDESFQIGMNEMKRVLAIIRRRGKLYPHPR